jgi:hypothetical protein
MPWQLLDTDAACTHLLQQPRLQIAYNVSSKYWNKGICLKFLGMYVDDDVKLSNHDTSH